ncbi:MAG TPA: adenylate/guanylate cyclase domain-containing protein [Mesorhizobium sp.]|jgi:class 3 adenylate cyclase
MEWGDVIKIVAPALAVLGAVVALTRYVTQLQDRLDTNNQIQEFKIKVAALEQAAELRAAQHESELKVLRDDMLRLSDQNRTIEERYRLAIEASSAVAALKTSVDAEMQRLADRLGASAHSILVPNPSVVPNDPVDHLVFLCLVPENQELRHERISLSSVAGQVLNVPKPVITHDPATAGAFSKQTDLVSGLKTANMLVVPLLHKGRCIGVAEFLNKRSGLSFDPNDIDVAEETAQALAPKVGDFIADPINMKALGFTPRQRPTDATILVSDISNSSKLAKTLDVSVVIDLLNQYMEALCDVGMRFGGTVEQLQGDGFIMTFNVRRPLDQHHSAALGAALEMQKRFRELKAKWINLQYPGMQNVFNRIGLTSGPVNKAELGPPQFRQITVIGDAVNAAAHLCQAGSRDRDVIVAGNAFYQRLDVKPEAMEVALPVTRDNALENAFDLTIPA